jgi:hypothetical protein
MMARQVYPDQIERAAAATWWRCRSLADRKSQETWQGVSEETRDAWRSGARYALEAAQCWLDGLGTDPTLP